MPGPGSSSFMKIMTMWYRSFGREIRIMPVRITPADMRFTKSLRYQLHSLAVIYKMLVGVIHIHDI